MARPLNKSLLDVCPDIKQYLASVVDPSTIGKSSRRMLWFRCRECGKMLYRRVGYYTDGKGLCNACNRKHVAKCTSIRAVSRGKSLLRWLIENNMDVPEVLDGTDISMVSMGSSRYIRFRCTLGHEFKQSPEHITKGMWCPFCGRVGRVSKPALCLYYALKSQIELQLEYTVPGTRLSLDMYSEKRKIGIEFDGQRFHKDIQRDLDKDSACMELGIQVLHIREPKCPHAQGEPLTWFYLNRPVDGPEKLSRALAWIRSVLTLPVGVTVDDAWSQMLANLYNGKVSNSVWDHINKHLYTDTFIDDKARLQSLTVSENRSKINVQCAACGYMYGVTPSNYFKHNSRCPRCAGAVADSTNSIMTTIYGKYFSALNMIDPNTVYKKSDSLWIWQCEEGHYFAMQAWAVSEGRWCPICSNNVTLEGYNDLETFYPKVAECFVDKREARRLSKHSKFDVTLQCPICGLLFVDKPLRIIARRHICKNWRKHDET